MSQDDLILKALQRGDKLTPLDAMQEPYRCMRLASRISALRQKGEPIHDRWFATPSGKRVKQYYMEIPTELFPVNRVAIHGGL